MCPDKGYPFDKMTFVYCALMNLILFYIYAHADRTLVAVTPSSPISWLTDDADCRYEYRMRNIFVRVTHTNTQSMGSDKLQGNM